jgi:hypothetical protein
MKFSLRDILWLMVVVGLSLGWWAEHRRIGLAPAHRKTLTDILASHNVTVSLDSEGIYAQGPLGDDKAWVDYQALGTKGAVLSEIRGQR